MIPTNETKKVGGSNMVRRISMLLKRVHKKEVDSKIYKIT